MRNVVIAVLLTFAAVSAEAYGYGSTPAPAPAPETPVQTPRSSYGNGSWRPSPQPPVTQPPTTRPPSYGGNPAPAPQPPTQDPNPAPQPPATRPPSYGYPSPVVPQPPVQEPNPNPNPAPLPPSYGGNPVPAPQPPVTNPNPPTQPPVANPSVCPNGGLNTPYLVNNGSRRVPSDRWYGHHNMSIPAGVTRTYCLNIEPPFVDANRKIRRIILNISNVPDYHCAGLDVSFWQTFAPYFRVEKENVDGGRIELTSGRQKVGGYGSNTYIETTPELVQTGMFILKVTGRKGLHPENIYCENHRIGWSVVYDDEY